MIYVRSFIFNLAFYACNTIMCISIVWMLLLPHRYALKVIQLYMRFYGVIERALAGLHYTLSGCEHFPASGCYLVAMKHQSTWETYKIHEWLHDPATVMKAELKYIPFWGWYAAKLRSIFVERGRARAYQSLLEGGEMAKAQGRPIVIFPQGTRVAYQDKKPYKRGVIELYTKLNVPIIPVALNSGKFWPRHSFIVKPGTITVRVLPPIPAGLDAATALQQLETAIETASNAL